MIREGLEFWLELGFVRKTLFSVINGELGLGWGLGLLTCIFSLFRSLLFFAASFLFCCLAIFSSILKAFFCWRLVIWASILLSTDYKWTFRCNLWGEENFENSGFTLGILKFRASIRFTLFSVDLALNWQFQAKNHANHIYCVFPRFS